MIDLKFITDEQMKKQHIPGLYDTREYEDFDKESLYDSACDIVDDETVFIIKKGGENL